MLYSFVVYWDTTFYWIGEHQSRRCVISIILNRNYDGQDRLRWSKTVLYHQSCAEAWKFWGHEILWRFNTTRMSRSWEFGRDDQDALAAIAKRAKAKLPRVGFKRGNLLLHFYKFSHFLFDSEILTKKLFTLCVATGESHRSASLEPVHCKKSWPPQQRQRGTEIEVHQEEIEMHQAEMAI